MTLQGRQGGPRLPGALEQRSGKAELPDEHARQGSGAEGALRLWRVCTCVAFVAGIFLLLQPRAASQAGFDDPTVYSLGRDISDDKEDAAVLCTIFPFLEEIEEAAKEDAQENEVSPPLTWLLYKQVLACVFFRFICMTPCMRVRHRAWMLLQQTG